MGTLSSTKLKRESKKFIEAGGKDIADNNFMAFATSIVNTGLKAGTNFHAATPFVNEIAIHRNKLRMLKRAHRKREMAKK